MVFSTYPDDVRVRREAEALVETGIATDVVCLRKGSQSPFERVNGVNVYRIDLEHTHGGKLRYVWEYWYFLVAASLKLWRLHSREHYDFIHVHNMPDFLVAGALIPKLAGSKVLLDLHDPMPELYMTIFRMNASHPLVRALKILEKWSIRFADLVITPNIAFRELFISRSCPAGKIHVVMNSPDERIFHRDSPQGECGAKDGKGFSLIFHGLIAERHGLDTAVEAVSKLRGEIEGLVLHVYGSGPQSNQVRSLVDELGLQETVKFHGDVSLEEIAVALSTMDVGIISNRMNAFTMLNMPTRIFECLSLGKPVIAPGTRGIRDYFDDGSLYFFEAGSAADLAGVIREVYANPARRQEVVERGMAVYDKHRWAIQRDRFISLVAGLGSGCETGARSVGRCSR
jgi:glycosyltransferase involved in cell wall biosynthesis